MSFVNVPRGYEFEYYLLVYHWTVQTLCRVVREDGAGVKGQE